MMLRLETIVILLVGTEELHTIHVILSTENLILRLWCSITLVVMIATLIYKNLGFSEGNIDCIPNNEERYISFTKRVQVGSYTKKGENKPLHHQIRFIDSFKVHGYKLR